MSAILVRLTHTLEPVMVVDIPDIVYDPSPYLTNAILKALPDVLQLRDVVFIEDVYHPDIVNGYKTDVLVISETLGHISLTLSEISVY